MIRMQSLNDDERREVLGEVLADELKLIREYVQEVPSMKQEIHQVKATVDDMSEKLTVIEHVIKDHESELKVLKRKAA
jgi:archaellum component FlaC